MHKNADKFWIQKYDGHNWNFEKIEDDNLPEELLLDILGSRNNVLFVEGEKVVLILSCILQYIQNII